MDGYEGAEVTWESGRYGGAMGYVNGVHMFTISWQHGANKDKPYKLSTQLPGKGSWRGRTEDVLKAHARTVLVEFAASIVRPVVSGDANAPDF